MLQDMQKGQSPEMEVSPQMTDWRTSYNGTLFLCENEGVVLECYADSVGVLTIGVGHTSGAGWPNPADVVGNITVVQAILLFKADLIPYEGRVNDALTYEGATQYQFDAAVSFDYNTGAIHSANWVDAWNRGDLDEAAAEFMNWTEPPEVTSRRQREQDLFATGNYAEPFEISVWDVWGSSPRVVVVPPGVGPPAPLALGPCEVCGAERPDFCGHCGTAFNTLTSQA
jgi:GH24 family phage-related lysozyme (muramidase)